MLNQRNLQAVSSLIQKASNGLSCSTDWTLTGHRAISTGVRSKQRRRGECALNPMNRDTEQRVRRKYVQKTDFAHPKGLRSVNPFTK